jgi:ferredoxin
MSNKHAARLPRPVESERIPLKARKVSFSWEDTPLHWVPGEPFATHTMNVPHLLLPAGERWFVHVYKQVLPHIRDERLRADVIGFIGQEAMHSQAHDEVLPHLRELGLDPTPYTAQVDWFSEKLLGDRTLPPGRARKWWLMETVGRRLPDHAALHLERFTPSTSAEGNGAFEVELSRSARTVSVAADTTVLAAVRAELPDTAYSCEQGFCGTCQQRVLEGEIEHRDELLTDTERGDSMLICVSRARGDRIVLDM